VCQVFGKTSAVLLKFLMNIQQDVYILLTRQFMVKIELSGAWAPINR
jgi:hypothetical protein